MKKILIVMDSLRIGGVQTALINLLHAIDPEKYSVDLVLFHYQDSYRPSIPENINVIKMPFILDTMNYSGTEIKKATRIKWFVKKSMALLCRIFGSELIYSIVFLGVNELNCRYDVAISYSNNINNHSTYFGVNKFVLEKVKAKKKVTWLHVDYDAMNMFNSVNNSEYPKFDEIVHVSEAVREVFLNYFPELKQKSKVIYNLVNTSTIHDKAKQENFKRFQEFSIITVARLDQNKNVIEGLRVAKSLKDDGCLYKWLIIGDGPMKAELERYTTENGLTANILFLGYKDNPFPYVIQSDLYVSTSISESFGLSIIEANSLGVPALVKNYPAAKEIIDSGLNGYIVDSEDEMYEILKSLITEPEKYNQLKKTCKPKISDGETMRIFEEFIESEDRKI